MLKSLTLVHAIIGAVVLVLVALIVFRDGLLYSLAWIGAIALVVIGVVNKLSYSAGY